MDFNFAEALAALTSAQQFQIANGSRPPADHLFASILPEENRDSYEVNDGSMTIRTTMAGLTGMDSPYPPGGAMTLAAFLEKTAKTGIHVPLTEGALRQLQALLMRTRLNNGDVNSVIQGEALNFYDKVVIQALLDTAEWLRGQAIVNGAIAWQMNGQVVSVDYGIPAANILPTRTGTAHYGGTASAFWSDMRLLRSRLKNNIRVILANSATMDLVSFNDVNNLRVVAQGDGFVTVRRYTGTTEQPSGDARDTVTITLYDGEGEILDPTDPSTPIIQKYLADGKFVGIAQNTRNGYRVGEGATPDPQNNVAIGYTHLAPTTEGGGRPGRWGRIYVPEARPMQIHGQGASNLLPVIRAPEKIATATTAMS